MVNKKQKREFIEIFRVLLLIFLISFSIVSLTLTSNTDGNYNIHSCNEQHVYRNVLVLTHPEYYDFNTRAYVINEIVNDAGCD